MVFQVHRSVKLLQHVGVDGEDVLDLLLDELRVVDVVRDGVVGAVRDLLVAAPALAELGYLGPDDAAALLLPLLGEDEAEEEPRDVARGDGVVEVVHGEDVGPDKLVQEVRDEDLAVEEEVEEGELDAPKVAEADVGHDHEAVLEHPLLDLQREAQTDVGEPDVQVAHVEDHVHQVARRVAHVEVASHLRADHEVDEQGHGEAGDAEARRPDLERDEAEDGLLHDERVEDAAEQMDRDQHTGQEVHQPTREVPDEELDGEVLAPVQVPDEVLRGEGHGREVEVLEGEHEHLLVQPADHDRGVHVEDHHGERGRDHGQDEVLQEVVDGLEPLHLLRRHDVEVKIGDAQGDDGHVLDLLELLSVVVAYRKYDVEYGSGDGEVQQRQHVPRHGPHKEREPLIHLKTD